MFADVRIGCVPYLNARPLVWGIAEQVNFKIPSLLADEFAAGAYDVALIPLFEALRMPEPEIVDGVCISCLGAVRSVILAHCEPLEKVQEIVVDPASRSSTNLLRVLLKEYFCLSPRLIEKSQDPQAARLIIGDPALMFQETAQNSSKLRWQILDLGQAWHDWTKLPFVFAVWTLRKNAPNAPAVAAALRTVAERGKNARPLIASREPHPPLAQEYLMHYIRYQLGPEEKTAIDHFYHLLKKIGSLQSESTPRFI